MRWRGLAVALTGLALGACGWVVTSVEVLEAEASADGRAVTLTVDACGGELSVRVKESDESVTVYAGARNAGDGECRGVVVVELEQPLGGRRLIDGFDFTIVEVRRGG